MLPLYQELNHLPSPPADAVDNLVDQWIGQYGSFTRQGNFPNLELRPTAELLAQRRQRISTFDPIRHEIVDWLHENIFSCPRSYSKWIFRVNHLQWKGHQSGQLIDLYEKHLDSTYGNKNFQDNTYVLIYNITESLGDMVIYQEEGHPLIRTADRPVYKSPTGNLHQNPHDTLVFPNCKEIARFPTKSHVWYLSRIDVIHSVERCNLSPRAAFQVRLTDDEVKNLLNINN